MSANFIERQQLAINSQSSLRNAFLSFYQENERLFTQQERAEALKYFDGEGENLDLVQLYERRVQCLKICQSAKLFAEEKQRAAQAERDLQQLFQIKIMGEDITAERKKALQVAFDEAKALADKQAVLEQIEQEATRARALHRYEKEQVELYLHLFKQFYDQDDCLYYFNDADRALAWQSLVSSCETLQHMAQKLDRLKLLVTLLPSSLQWARQQYETYKKVLKEHDIVGKESTKSLAHFRNQTFEEKHLIIEQTKDLPKKTREKQKEADENSQPGSKQLIEDYQKLYCGQADLPSVATYRKHSIAEQAEILTDSQRRHSRTEALLHLWQQQSDQPRSAEAIASWQKLSLLDQEKSIILIDKPTQTSKEQITSTHVARIAIEIIRNKEQKIYHDETEQVKAVKTALHEKNLVSTFDLKHLHLITSLLQTVPKETWHTAKTVQWVDNHLRTELYVG